MAASRLTVLVFLTFPAAMLTSLACLTQATPYQKAELLHDAQVIPKRALLHYLSQDNADPRVCRRGAEAMATERTLLAVAKALTRSELPKRSAERCVQQGLDSLPYDEAKSLLASVSELYLARLSLADAAQDHNSLRRVLLHSRFAADHPRLLRQLEETLDDALAASRLPSNARAGVTELRDAISLSDGRWRGATVDEPLIRKQPDPTLAFFEARLGPRRLRLLAREELVTRRVAASTHPDVRRDVEGATKRMMETGYNFVDLRTSPVLSSTLGGEGPGFGTLVRQAPLEHAAKLVAIVGHDAKLLPRLDLTTRVSLRVDGFEQAVSLCRADGRLDPTPCVAASQLHIDSPWMTLRKDGTVSFSERGTIEDAMELLDRTPVSTPLRLMHHETEIGQFDLPVRFQAPAPVVFSGGAPGERGPALDIDVREKAGHLLLEFRSAGQTMHAIIPLSDPGSFAVTNQGPRGRGGSDGHQGSTGTPGMSGRNATCSSDGSDGGMGGRGGDGGPGGNGGPGGDGGDVNVHLECAPERCASLRAWLEARVHSVGGEGGSGGRGGRGGSGGRGGRGGSGTSCREQTRAASYSNGRSEPAQYRTVRRSGGSNGSAGMDGSRGMDGSDGRPGEPGTVTITTSAALGEPFDGPVLADPFADADGP